MNKVTYIIGIVLIMTLVFCTCALSLVGCNSNKELIVEPNEDTDQLTDSGLQFEYKDTPELGLSVQEIDPEDYEDFGVSMAAESAYTLTATVLPDYAYNKKVDWKIFFSDSSWSSGKTVSDYCSIKPTSDGSLTATLEFKNPFGAQIVVECVSRDNPEAIGECYVDCAKRITGFSSFTIGSCSFLSSGSFLNTLEFSYNYDGVSFDSVATYSDSTISDYFSIKVEMSINELCKSALEAKGFTCLSSGEYFIIRSAGNFVLSAFTGSYAALIAQGSFPQLRSDFLEAMRSIGVGNQVGSIKITCTGTYSTYVQVYPIKLDSTCTITPVSEVHINDSGITI